MVVEYIILPKDRAQLPDVSGLDRKEKVARIKQYFTDLAASIGERFPEVEIVEALALCVVAKMPEEMAPEVAQAFDCSLMRADTKIFRA